MDSLEAFEKSLAVEKEERERENSAEVPNDQHRRRRHEAGHSGRNRRECVDDEHDSRRHKRPRRDGNEDTHQRSRGDEGYERRGKAHAANRDGHYTDTDLHREGKDRSRHHKNNNRSRSPASAKNAEERLDHFRKTSDSKVDPSLPDEKATPAEATSDARTPLVRDSWMMGPSAIDIDYVRSRDRRPRSLVSNMESPRPDADPTTLPNNGSAGDDDSGGRAGQVEQVIDYTFGDEGSQWRMTKLTAVFAMAEETGQSVEQVALHQYGNLKFFDDAREEKGELERRAIYGRGYVEKATSSGDLHRNRCREQDHAPSALIPIITPDQSAIEPGFQVDGPSEGTCQAMTMDPTALNRLRAKLMKAKLRGDDSAATLEAEYAQAAREASSVTARPEPRLESGQPVEVIGAMESRHLVGRRGEVKAADNRRARDRGQVVGNDDMTIEDMVREERRTRWQAGEESSGLAKRIANDGRFENKLEYMDENAEKLARRVHRSEINLRGMAVGEMQKITRIMDNCLLCHDEDTGRRPATPVVSLGTRVFLTLPPEPELGEFGAVLVPTAHRANLLECDDDEWEELRNFMKSLTRMYHDLGREPVFYEDAARQRGGAHATMHAVSIPYADGATAPAFFREALLEQAEEWSQHRKLIDTAARARDGLGRTAFRKTLAREMPYFHVWFSLDGGLGHVVENVDQWPRGDLFARQVLGGILDADPAVIHRQGRWAPRGPHAGSAQDQRVDEFRRRWRKFDWTRVLAETDKIAGGG